MKDIFLNSKCALNMELDEQTINALHISIFHILVIVKFLLPTALIPLIQACQSGGPHATPLHVQCGPQLPFKSLIKDV